MRHSEVKQCKSAVTLTSKALQVLVKRNPNHIKNVTFFAMNGDVFVKKVLIFEKEKRFCNISCTQYF